MLTMTNISIQKVIRFQITLVSYSDLFLYRLKGTEILVFPSFDCTICRFINFWLGYFSTTSVSAGSSETHTVISKMVIIYGTLQCRQIHCLGTLDFMIFFIFFFYEIHLFSLVDVDKQYIQIYQFHCLG